MEDVECIHVIVQLNGQVVFVDFCVTNFFNSRCMLVFFFFKQKTAYEMRISDWSSDVCSSDLGVDRLSRLWRQPGAVRARLAASRHGALGRIFLDGAFHGRAAGNRAVRGADYGNSPSCRCTDGDRALAASYRSARPPTRTRGAGAFPSPCS